MVKSIKKLFLLVISFALLVVLIFSAASLSVSAFNDKSENAKTNYILNTSILQSEANDILNLSILQVEEMIESVINWKKNSLSLDNEQSIFGSEFLQFAGSTAGDWLPIGLGRYGYSDDYEAYLAVIADYVNKKYTDKNKLDGAKATEWHRISLAITACGGNPLEIGSFDGSPINLIEDGTYNRGLTASVGKQGINGYIWALIALDSMRYSVPSEAFNTRQDFILEILKSQLADGGFALIGNVSDTDVTAMALQALAPYYNSEKIYSYSSIKIKDDSGKFSKFEKSIKQVVDEALAMLSKTQLGDGDYSSWGTANVESACQVILALTALNNNPLLDSRFIKNNKTLLDGIKKYQLDNGGFTHSFTYDSDNPSSKPNEANDMASDQALCALVSLLRNLKGMRTFFDMRNEFSIDEEIKINKVIYGINELSTSASKAEIETVLSSYNEVSELDRCYITNYWKLSSLLKNAEIEPPEEKPDYGDGDSGSDEVLTYFALSDELAVKSLPQVYSLNTSYFTEVVRLKYKLTNAENANDFMDCQIVLDKAYNQILFLQKEIDAINAEILDKLHPFEKIGLSDKKNIESILKRYNALSEYDKTKITHYEDLIKSKTQVDNLTVAVIISACSFVLLILLAFFIALNIYKRKKKKQAKAMTESEE